MPPDLLKFEAGLSPAENIRKVLWFQLKDTQIDTCGHDGIAYKVPDRVQYVR